MSKAPDYILKVGAMETKYSRRVGAAWNNRAGGINITLDPGIAIVGGEGISITLWPADEDKGKGGDDIPF